MEFAFSTIVCATDLTSESQGAEAAAVFFAQKHNATLQIISCNETFGDTFAYALESGAGYPEAWTPQNYDHISEVIDKAVRNRIANLAPNFPPQKLRVSVRFGSTAGVILEEIKDLQPTKSLLVVGKRHKGKIEKILLGSVSQRIVSRSHIPVLVVPESAERAHWPPQNILAATSCRPGSEEAEFLAAHLAAQFQVQLHLVHIFEPPQPYFLLEPQLAGAGQFDFVNYEKLDEEMRHHRMIELQRHQTKIAEICAPVSSTLKSGVVVDELLHYVTLQKAGLVVLGSHAGGGLKRFFLGGKALQVVQLCSVPLLIVRHEDYAVHEH